MDLNELRKQAKNSGIKMGSLAERIGVNRSTFSRFVNGKSDLNGSKILKLIEVLKQNAETLKKKAS